MKKSPVEALGWPGTVALSVAGSLLTGPVVDWIASELGLGRLVKYGIILVCLLLVVGGVRWLVVTKLQAWARRQRPTVEFSQTRADRAQVVIATFGGKTEPVKKLVEYHKPKKLVLLATTGERGTLPAAQELAQQLTDSGSVCQAVAVDDAFDMTATQRAAKGILSALTPEELASTSADITGGTVPMSLGLLAAASQYGVEVTYMPPEAARPDGRGAVPSDPRVVEFGLVSAGGASDTED